MNWRFNKQDKRDALMALAFLSLIWLSVFLFT